LSIRLIAPSRIFGSRIGAGRFGGVAMMISACEGAHHQGRAAHPQNMI
jgi:hypothetical protein